MSLAGDSVTTAPSWGTPPQRTFPSDSHSVSTQIEPDPESIAAALLPWIGAARRDLPWRRRRDPYAVWVSEVMLQQTQAATVIPYYERWMARFGDVATLAAASLEEVLKVWEGLGYYARARNLYRAARQIVARHGGQLPADRQALLALPGIGPYTAGAILSLAFGKPEPVLDGNVRRVLCRLYDIGDPPRKRVVEKRLWELAAALARAAPGGEAGSLNEGLMELGALVCTPDAPDCLACPLAATPFRAGQCLAWARGTQLQRPVQVARRRTPHHRVTAAVIRNHSEQWLIVQRPENGLLGNLWGFPGDTVAEGGDDLVTSLQEAVRRRVGIEIRVSEPIATIRHVYTHFRITLHAFHCEWLSGEPGPFGYADVRWVSREDLRTYPFPRTDRKIEQALPMS